MKTLPALFFSLALAGWAGAADVHRDVEYARPGGIPVLMDYRIPDGPGPFPAVIIVHGGGWSGGSKSDPQEVAPILDPLTNGNIAWFSINYRVSGQARYPACIEDTEAAVQFVKAHAQDYNIDPHKVALSGDSAGGHIVDMVAVRATPDQPERHLAAVVCFYGPNDLVEDSFRRNTPSPSLQALFGIPPTILDAPTVKLLQDASPIAFVSPNLPPYLLIHGTADTSVDYPGSLLWKDALDALGVPCELITIPLGAHVMGTWARLNPPQEAYKAQFVAWLQKQFAKIDDAAKTPALPAAATASVTKDHVAGLWKNAKGPDGSGIYLAADGTGNSLLAPACAVKWSFDPATAAVHLDYPAGQGRAVPYAGSPEMAQSAKDKITKAGLRPTVSFYDFHYFPTQDIMISSNGDVYRRQPQAAADAFLKTKSD